MGSPPVDGGRHRQHEPDIGAPRTIMFTASLPDRDIDQLIVHVPAPRAALDPPTEAIRHVVPAPADHDPYDATYWDGDAVQDTAYLRRTAPSRGGRSADTVRHVVVPAPADYDPYDATYWDGDVVRDTAYVRRTPPSRGGRWGVVLGALVVTGCATYIAVVGIAGLRGDAARPASAALTAPQVSATFPASAVPPVSANAVAPTSRVAVPARAPVTRPVVPATTKAGAPAAATVTPTADPVVKEEPVQGAQPEDGNPRLADPPGDPEEQGSPASPQPRTGPVPSPPPSAGSTAGGSRPS